jgi:hypothetical protein
MKRKLAAAASGLFLLSSPALAEQVLVIKPLVEQTVAKLPNGPLFWRVENFSTVAQAQEEGGPTGLVAEAGGKVWLFMLGPAGTMTGYGDRVAFIGPLPEVVATQYLLRINEVSGPLDSISAVHTHPGSEAFYVIAGETSQRTSHGITRVTVGQSMVGHGAETPMQVSSSGAANLHSLEMFVVDASKPFSSPANFQ